MYWKISPSDVTLTPSLADPRVHVVSAEVPGERSLAGPNHSLLFGMIEHVKGRPPWCQRGTCGLLVHVGERLTSAPKEPHPTLWSHSLRVSFVEIGEDI